VFYLSLSTNQPPTAFIGGRVDETCLLENIDQALSGILNAITHNDTNGTLLNEPYITKIGSILNVRIILDKD